MGRCFVFAFTTVSSPARIFLLIPIGETLDELAILDWPMLSGTKELCLLTGTSVEFHTGTVKNAKVALDSLVL